MPAAKKSKFINRELSWLEFNQRVLDQAWDERVPLLERLKFLAISGSNLDEFFMVRVGGLMTLARQKSRKTDAAGMTPNEQIEAIGARAHAMAANQYSCYSNKIEPELARLGIRRMHPDELTENQHKHISHLFANEIMPILTPIAVSADSSLPLLTNRGLHLITRMKDNLSENPSAQRFVIIPIPPNLDRFITLPAEGMYAYILLEDVLKQHIEYFFADTAVMECSIFRLTRNADMSVQEDLAGDLLSEMEAVIEARARSECVRLEVEDSISQTSLKFLQRVLGIGNAGIFREAGPIDYSAFIRLTGLSGFDNLRYTPWPAHLSIQIKSGRSIFDIIRARNILLYHPYESFDPVLRLIDESADDPDVVAIKQVLYRTSRNSPVIAALARAAENGKYVTVLVELKARFDEERNIEWARELEDAGVQVIYGLKGLKTHAKICIVLRKEPQGLQKYMHFGTGNYNEITARLYSDISYMTCDEDLGGDATAFFNTITGYSQPRQYRKIEAAPIGLRKMLISLIDAETERKRQGQKARIIAKMNSLVDSRIIRSLYAASKAGVKIQLNVRGICCLRPGIKGQSENIVVTSVVDRFLEHARIFYFYNGGDERVFISSADWMPRNLDRRVELMTPVEDPECQRRLVKILETHFADTHNAWELHNDGSYKRIVPPRNRRPFQSQEALYLQVCKMTEQNRQQRIEFEPHRPPPKKP